MRVTIEVSKMYAIGEDELLKYRQSLTHFLSKFNQKIVWTKSLKRVFTLCLQACKNKVRTYVCFTSAFDLSKSSVCVLCSRYL